MAKFSTVIIRAFGMLLSPMALIVVGIIIWIQRSRNKDLLEDELVGHCDI